MNTGRNYVSAGSIATTDLQTSTTSCLSRSITGQATLLTTTSPNRQQARLKRIISKLSIAEMDQMADFVFGPSHDKPESKPIRQSEALHARTPFEAAAHLAHFRRAENKSRRGIYACYLNGQQLIRIQRIAERSQYYPVINVERVVKQAQTVGADRVILATWHWRTAEQPCSMEHFQEVERQYRALRQHSICLVDNLRLSDTGLFSYWAEGDEPLPFQRRATKTGDNPLIQLYPTRSACKKNPASVNP